MRILSLSLALLVTASAATAAPIHNIATRATCGSNTDSTARVLQRTTQIASATAGPPANSEANCSAGASARVGDGTIRVQASVVNPGDDDSLNLIRGSASASGSLSYTMRFLALVENPDPLMVSVNMNATGTAFASSNQLYSDNGAFLNSGQIVSAGIRAFGTLSSGGQSASFEERANVRANPGQSFTDSLPGNFTTEAISVRPGANVSLSFGLDSGASGQLLGAEAIGRVSAMRSLSFATEGPVFNFTEGYQLLIDEPRIVNNRYYAPGTPLPGSGMGPTPSPAPIPLPAAGWALLAGLGMLLTLRGRRTAT